MFVIGITGPTGAGKTTALRVLEEMGGAVFDCDAIYHELLRTDGALLGRIEAAFPGVVQNYVLDRKALGRRVFADPKGLDRLTGITWPAVRRKVRQLLENTGEERAHTASAFSARAPVGPCGTSRRAMLGATSHAFWRLRPYGAVRARPPSPVPCSPSPVPSFCVIDAIGLFESGLSDLCDLTAAVVADEEVRVRRLMARDGITEDYARARIAAQKPAQWFAARADLVLENNGSEAEFAARCRTEFEKRTAVSMREFSCVTLRERPELKQAAAEWFHSKWGVPTEAYLECMEPYLAGQTELGWYLCLEADRIVGGLGVIENDFHDRKDLSPNVCAVYTEEDCRGRGIAGRLLHMAVEDLRSKGISPVYLVTDHTGFYERYGWEFFCHAQGDGEDHLTRLYIHC